MAEPLRGSCSRVLSICLLTFFLTTGLFAQNLGTIRGTVTDPSGAAIPGANVTASGPNSTVKVGSTNEQGTFTINGLPAGSYTVRALTPGFTVYENTVDVGAGRAIDLNIALSVSLEKQTITVTETSKIDVDPSNNAGALVLKGADLDALSDDPDDMQADLQALAGPSAGPNGGQIYIDGFTGGRLPPKESIREIRINQNPFSAEFDRLGFGRIEIFTKPGTDKYHGQAFFSYGNAVFNARNPFALERPDYQARQFDANFGGPLSKKSSFFIDAERRMDEPVALINAITLSSSFLPTAFNQSLVTPVTRTTVSPRIDYQLSTNNSLTARYTWSYQEQDNQGASTFSLPTRTYNANNYEQTAQLTETWVANAKLINETRFQYIRNRDNQIANGDNLPTIVVQDAFTGGGAPFLGTQYLNNDHYELQNYTSLTHGTHLTKFGVRVRAVQDANTTSSNYNGTFTFTAQAAGAGTAAATSLAAYQATVQGLANGLTFDQIRALGGGASYYTVATGNPAIDISQVDLGFFVQDDWRVKPNITLSLGLRYETQTNIHDWSDFAPRVALAWGIGGGSKPGSTPKMVLRVGSGIFYDRFSDTYSLTALQQNGINQLTYTIQNPNFFTSNIPAVTSLTPSTLTTREVEKSLRAPYIIQSVVGIEKSLPHNITVAVNYTNSHGLHQLRSVNLNAPLAGTYDPNVPNSGVFPYPGQGPLYGYESSGLFNQNQVTVNSNARVNTKISLFGFYSLGKANSNTDGAGTFPSNPYNYSQDYGRASFDIRHRAVIGGRVATRFGLAFSPFIQLQSGAPFNIITGTDLNGDRIINDRPAFATDLSRPSVIQTPYGAFDLRPLPGATLVPRNYLTGPGQFTINMRVSRVWSWGERANANRGQNGQSNGPDMMRMGAGGGGPRGGGGGPRGGGGGRGGMGGGGGESGSGKYNIIASVQARNLLNHTNYGTPVGTLTSPDFGRSLDLAGGFGPASSSANRRIELQVRFQF